MKSFVPDYKTTQIHNRRFLGNKYKLLPFITSVVDACCPGITSVADIFAGTGAVSSAFPGKVIYTNDILYSNYICNYAWFSPDEYNAQLIIDYVQRYNAISGCADNYMTRHFSDTYFSRDDCAKIGFIREDIENNYQAGKINARERAILITSLMYAMDKIAQTCGHYDAYRRDAVFDEPLELSVPLVPKDNNLCNRCFNEDANELVRHFSADLVYIDPPYNSRQYCDAYHLLENVARWEQPEVFGVARKMDRRSLKSRYCTKSAPEAFADLIENIDAKFILLSYNNMAQKGNDRSNAKISDDEILQILQSKGSVRVFSE